MIFVGESPIGYGLPERAGFIKKGLSTGELVSLVKAKQITLTSSWNYWSSSENADNSNNAWNVNFNNGNVNNNNKNNNEFWVRALFAFLRKPDNNKISK